MQLTINGRCATQLFTLDGSLNTLPDQLPDHIAFGYLDGNFYDSIMVSLENCVPRLMPGGALLIDDYADTATNPRAWDKLPGVKSACDKYFGLPSPVQTLIGEGIMAHGVYIKPTTT